MEISGKIQTLSVILLVVGLVIGSTCATTVATPSPSPTESAPTAPVSDVSLTMSSAGIQSDRIDTEHFEITYEEGQRTQAKEVASYADAYFELLFQRFGVEPPAGKVSVEIVAADTVDCAGTQRAGCYEGVGSKIVLTSADRGLFFHELTHLLQDESFGLEPGRITPEVIVEGTAYHIETPPDEIAATASFQRDAISFTDEDAEEDEYDELALFPEYVLSEYGREGYDVLYTEHHPRKLESVVEKNYSTIIEDFYSQLDEQKNRMRDGGASAPGFTYEPFQVAKGEEVTFDARTPDVIEAIDRTWYTGEVQSYEWDFDDDGDIDATGPTVTRTIEDPVGKAVTLYVTVDGEQHKVTQTLLPATSPKYNIQSVEAGAGAFRYTGSNTPIAAVPGQGLSIDVPVSNDGSVSGTKSAKLVFREVAADTTYRNVVVDRTTVDIPPGETETLTLSHDLEDIGTENPRYQIYMDGKRVWEGVVYVTNEVSVDTSPQYTGITVSAASDLKQGVSTGTEATVRVPAEVNPTGLHLPAEVKLYLEDKLIDTKETTLSSSHVDFNISVPEEAGEYELRAEITDKQNLLDGTVESNTTLTVLDKTPMDQMFAVNCGSEFRAYCGVYVESVDGPKMVEAGTESEFDIGLRLQESDSDTSQLRVPTSVGERNTKIETEMTNGTGQITVSETFEETGTYNISVTDVEFHTVTVVEDLETTSEEKEANESSDRSTTSSSDDEPTSERTSENRSTDDSSESEPDSSMPGFGVTTGAFSIVLLMVILSKIRY